MALTDHTIEYPRVSEELVEEIIAGRAKYDLARKTVVLLPGTSRLSRENRILLYLAALAGWSFVLPDDAPPDSASLEEISRNADVPVRSARPLLSKLLKRGALAEKSGAYSLPAHKLGVVREILLPSGADRGNPNVFEPIVLATKNADDFEEIFERIIDRSSKVDRVLLPLYIAVRDFGGGLSLSTTDIYMVLKGLGLNMALPIIESTLKDSASQYVLAGKPAKKNQPAPFRISRSGKKYVEEVLTT